MTRPRLLCISILVSLPVSISLSIPCKGIKDLKGDKCDNMMAETVVRPEKQLKTTEEMMPEPGAEGQQITDQQRFGLAFDLGVRTGTGLKPIKSKASPCSVGHPKRPKVKSAMGSFWSTGKSVEEKLDTSWQPKQPSVNKIDKPPLQAAFALQATVAEFMGDTADTPAQFMHLLDAGADSKKSGKGKGMKEKFLDGLAKLMPYNRNLLEVLAVTAENTMKEGGTDGQPPDPNAKPSLQVIVGIEEDPNSPLSIKDVASAVESVDIGKLAETTGAPILSAPVAVENPKSTDQSTIDPVATDSFDGPENKKGTTVKAQLILKLKGEVWEFTVPKQEVTLKALAESLVLLGNANDTVASIEDRLEISSVLAESDKEGIVVHISVSDGNIGQTAARAFVSKFVSSPPSSPGLPLSKPPQAFITPDIPKTNTTNSTAPKVMFNTFAAVSDAALQPPPPAAYEDQPPAPLDLPEFNSQESEGAPDEQPTGQPDLDLGAAGAEPGVPNEE